MLRELKCTTRYFDHIRDVTIKHFELRIPELASNQFTNDASAYRVYYRDIIRHRPTELTEHQKYLRDLEGLIGPVLSSYRTKSRIVRLQPRTRFITASSRLEDSAQRLAFEAYHFKERLKLAAKSSSAIVHANEERASFQESMGKIIVRFEAANQRVLRYRNFIVHGPDGRRDEFADLRSWELAGIFYHHDLWFEYNNAFWSAQEEWVALAQSLIASMEESLLKVQSANEQLISTGAFDFCSVQ